MNVVLKKLSEIRPYEKNPRINQEAIEYVKESIQTHGFNQPIVTNQNGVICVGNTRYYASLELELDEVPVLVKQMTEAQFIAYNLADNKTHEYSRWDNKILTELMQDLEILDEKLLNATAFATAEINALINQTNIDFQIEEDEIPVSAHTRTPSGNAEKLTLEIKLPNKMELQDLYDDLTHKGYVVKVK